MDFRNDRNDRNDRNNMDFRHNRMRNRSRFGGRGPMMGRRPQRPLLTSAINAAGLSLVAFMLVDSVQKPEIHRLLAYAVLFFSCSSFVSYFAQRTWKRWVEKISDVFFLGGILIVLDLVGFVMGWWRFPF